MKGGLNMTADILKKDSEAVCTALHDRLKSVFASFNIEEETYGLQAMEPPPVHPPDMDLRGIDMRRGNSIGAARRVFARRQEPEMSKDRMRTFLCVLGAGVAVFVGLLIAWIGLL
jgi:hypothetical protein